jgi:hypothetical protein
MLWTPCGTAPVTAGRVMATVALSATDQPQDFDVGGITDVIIMTSMGACLALVSIYVRFHLRDNDPVAPSQPFTLERGESKMVAKGSVMEISRRPFYVFDLDAHASLMSFVWTEQSAAMTVDDYKDAIRAYARLVLEHRARRALVNLRNFRFRAEDADVGTWWADEIVPLYNQAGLEKFAFVLPDGEQPPPDETPPQRDAGEKFVTRQFGSEQAAIAWLTAQS